MKHTFSKIQLLYIHTINDANWTNVPRNLKLTTLLFNILYRYAERRYFHPGSKCIYKYFTMIKITVRDKWIPKDASGLTMRNR